MILRLHSTGAVLKFFELETEIRKLWVLFLVKDILNTLESFAHNFRRFMDLIKLIDVPSGYEILL